MCVCVRERERERERERWLSNQSSKNEVILTRNTQSLLSCVITSIWKYLDGGINLFKCQTMRSNYVPPRRCQEALSLLMHEGSFLSHVIRGILLLYE